MSADGGFLADVDQRARSVALGVARITVGAMWLANLHWKVPPAFGEDTGGGLYKYSAAVLRHSTFAPFAWVTEELILPNFRLFGWLTLLAEMTVAVLLIAGRFTRLAALAGAALTVPILLTVLYYDRADEWSWSYLLMFAAHLLIYGSMAGDHLGVDGVVRGDARQCTRATVWVGATATIIGLAGLWVSRSTAFAGGRLVLLGSDAGFIDDGGALVRRWELKFVWFNPLWALVTVVAGLLALASLRLPWARLVAGMLGTAAGVITLAIGTFDYERSDQSIQVVATASNAALWFAFALSLLTFEWADRRTSP
jgi:thiosulfate dehydrogenase [quinone] large subunit